MRRYNLLVRLAVTILWSLAALLWLPWLMMLIRLVIDLAMGTPLNQSEFLTSVAGGIRPIWRILGPWQVLSWIPLMALIGMLLSSIGWRIYWQNLYGRLSRPFGTVLLSILVPPLAPLIMWQDSRNRYLEEEAELEQAVRDARLRVMPDN